MAMIIISKRLTESEIHNEVPDVVKQVTEWFEANPRRKTCRAQVWQGRTAQIHRDHIERDVKAAAFDLIQENKTAGVK